MQIFTGLRYHLTATDALEAAYNNSVSNYFQIQPTTAGEPAVSSRFERNECSFNYVRYLPRRGAVQPFLTVGLGVTQSSTLATGWHRYNPSLNYGLGTDFRINERLAFRVEVRDHVGFLPAPLRGASHDLAPTAGLVFSPRTSTPAPAHFPQVEVFLGGGSSILTGGGSGPYGVLAILNPNGQESQVYNTVGSNKYSKSGRLLAGFRVVFSNNNGLELSYTQGPNRYQVQQSIPAISVELPPMQVTLDVEDYATNYVRYLRGGRSLKPFVTAGVGLAHFAGARSDINRFGWNVGVGADLPLWNRLAARFEIRDYMSGQPAPGTGLVHNIAPTAGLAYRFK
ncbi:MAG: outer membrane beta-barrel protein [Terriglobia bacterium]|jgi:hypothetical protein